MLDISLDELIHTLGEPTRKTGHQYYFRCPACSSMGGDTSGDNLLYNARKGLLKCFACDDGAKTTLHLINQKRHDSLSYIAAPAREKKEYTPWWKLNIDNLYLYMCEAEKEMTTEVAEWLRTQHGIEKDTIEFMSIGYDAQPQPNMVKIGPSVVFPMISLNHNGLVGFELREVSTNKVIRHTLDAPSCLCIIAQPKDASTLCICEGFKDGYCLYQAMKSYGIDKEVTILTPAHGVDDIFANLSQIDFTQYTFCNLILDNDKAGDRATRKIIEQYPFFNDRRDLLQGCNDIAEWWMKHVHT